MRNWAFYPTCLKIGLLLFKSKWLVFTFSANNRGALVPLHQAWACSLEPPCIDFSCSGGVREPVTVHRPDLLWRGQRTKKHSLFFIPFSLKSRDLGEVRARTSYIYSLKSLTQFVHSECCLQTRGIDTNEFFAYLLIWKCLVISQGCYSFEN